MSVIELDGVFTPVPAPAVRPYRFGLFSVVPPTPEVGDAWEGTGVTWVSACPTPRVTHNPCIVDVVPDMTALAGCTRPEFDPFTVYDLTEMTTRREDEAMRTATDRLAASEQFAVELMLWDAVATAVTEVVAGGLTEALAFVEQALVEAYPGEGLIHMNRYTALMLDGKLEREGGKLTTITGTPVVAGGGYAPIDGAEPTTLAIYGTGPVVLRRGATQAIPTRDTSSNRSYALAYRTYVIGWDCAAVGATFT